MKYFTGLFFLLCSLAATGQQVKEFYDDNWKKTDSAFARYYRLITYTGANHAEGVVKNYYITGELQSEGRLSFVHASDKRRDHREGVFTTYYKNGNKNSEGYYIRGLRDGRYSEWAENGNMSAVAHYRQDTLNGFLLAWYPSGLLLFYGVYKDGKPVNSEYIYCSEYGDCGRFNYYGFRDYSRMSDYDYIDYEARDSEGISESLQNLLAEATRNKSSQDISNWKMYPAKGGKMSLNSHGLVITAPKNATTRVLTHSPTDPANNYYYVAEFSLRKSKDTSHFGLVVSYADDNNYLKFDMQKSGAVFIGGMKEGKPFSLYRTEGKSGYDYGDGSYILYAIKEKDSVTFMASYTPIAKIPVKEWFGSLSGVECGAGVEIVMESYTLAEEMEAPFVSPDFDAKTGAKGIWKGVGSGFALSEDGYIVTNHHVIDDAKVVEVDIVKDGEKYSYAAEIIVTDKVNDLAIIRIKDERFKGFGTIPYTLKTELADVGTPVFALGYPLAFSELSDELKFTEGTVNSRTGREGMVTAYQVSTPVQPGNSGGPLFDYNGNLLGVINEKIFFADNVAFAIKINYITNLVALLPVDVQLPSNTLLKGKPATEQVKMLRPFIPLIKVR